MASMKTVDAKVVDSFLECARRGLAKPSEIEAALKAKGFPPLASTPDPEKFDPMAEVWWTMGMAAAWIIWRTPHAVRLLWPDYRREVRVWVGPQDNPVFAYKQTGSGDETFRIETVNGYALEKPIVLPLIGAFLRSTLSDAEEGTPLIVGAEARRELWRKLEAGQLVAEGIRKGESARAPIRDAEWIDLDDHYQPDWPVDAIGALMEQSPRYLAVRVRRAQVIKLWPALKSVAAPLRPPKPLGRRDAICQAFGDLWPEGLPPGLMIQQRDANIVDWFKEKALPIPSSRTIARALRGNSQTHT